MNKTTALALSTLTALMLTAPTLAQTAMPAKPADTMSKPEDSMKMNDTMMKAAPTFAFSTDAGMNMMMSGGAVEITAVPGEKLVSRNVKGTVATLVYTGKNSGPIFAFYDKAIKSEGWKTTAMDGKMMAGASMAKPGDTMAAKPADAMAKPAAMTSSAMMGGTHNATFAMGGHTIDLNVREIGGRVTVTFKSK